MTSQSPRIYTYKITFEEVPYYYYGVKKEKYFYQYYMGSPYTHKWCWEFYTPKKQILELFEYSDEGWLEAQEIEKQLIKPFYRNDKWCLNENCGGTFSLDTYIRAGKRGNKTNKKNGTGVYGMTLEQKSEGGKRGGKNGGKVVGKQNAINKTGICGRSKEKMTEDGKKGGTASAKKQKELGIGFFGMSFEQRSQNAKKANETHKKNKTGVYALTYEDRSKMAEKVNSQRWMCTETSHISNSGGLSRYQRARGIDTSKRIRIE